MSLFVNKYRVDGAQNENDFYLLKSTVQNISGVSQVDVNFEKKLLRIASDDAINLNEINSALKSAGLSSSLREVAEDKKTLSVVIDGMHCNSCEILIENKWARLPGVESVSVSATKGKAKIHYVGEKPTLTSLQDVIINDGYKVRGASSQSGVGDAETTSTKPSLSRLILLFAIVIILGRILSNAGLLQPNLAVGTIGFGAAIIIGLISASSSCIAVTGGVLVSLGAEYRKRFGEQSFLNKIRPTVLFCAGRVLSYTVLGAIIGLVGKALNPSPLVTGFITIIAALYMLVVGLDLLEISPLWLKKFTPSFTKGIARKFFGHGSDKTTAPFVLGGATFFLPCGFTQALQLYALTTHSPLLSALALGGFALGTVPALFALGIASSSLKGAAGKVFMQFSGAMVVVLGIWNFQNGFAIAGKPLSFTSISGANSIQAVSDANGAVEFDGKVQTVRMTVTGRGYSPSTFTLRRGVPTRWIINASGQLGCASVLQAPKIGVQKLLANGENIIEFTPENDGAIPFSCSMGMFRGEIKVVDNS